MSLLYLLSSLPMLRFGTPPPITPEAFLAACRDQLSEADASAAAALLRGDASDHPFAVAWHDREVILRNAVARQRARRADLDPNRWIHPARECDSRIEAGVENAFEAPDPLKREQELDRVRWLAAEELEGYDPLSVKKVLGYAIRLTLLLRWSAIDAARGQHVFNTLTDTPITLDSAGG